MFLYNILRYYIDAEKITMQGFGSVSSFLSSSNVAIGQICFPVAMVSIFWLSGYYNNVFRKSLLQEFATTFMSTGVCMLLVFFVALINDTVIDHYHNYEMLLILWATLFVCIYPARLLTTFAIKRRIARSQIEFATLIVGCGNKAMKYAHELHQLKWKLGYRVVGFVTYDSCPPGTTADGIPVFDIDEIGTVCQRFSVTDLIVVPQSIYRPNHGRKNWFVGVSVVGMPEMFHLNENEITYETFRASGPGGQHVNKTESAVRATHVPSGISVTASDRRSQPQNKKMAKERLLMKIALLQQSQNSKNEYRNWNNHNMLRRGNPVKVFKKPMK